MLKGWSRIVLIGLTVFSSLCGFVYAAEDKVKFALTADYFTKYVWRGQNLNDSMATTSGRCKKC